MLSSATQRRAYMFTFIMALLIIPKAAEARERNTAIDYTAALGSLGAECRNNVLKCIAGAVCKPHPTNPQPYRAGQTLDLTCTGNVGDMCFAHSGPLPKRPSEIGVITRVYLLSRQTRGSIKVGPFATTDTKVLYTCASKGSEDYKKPVSADSIVR